MFSIFLNVYLEVALLGRMITLWLICWETAKILFKVAGPFYILSISVWGFQFLHILATARENLREAPVVGRWGPSFHAFPGEQSRVLPPNTRGGLTPFKPLSGLQDIPVRLERRAESFASPRDEAWLQGESGMQPRDSCRPLTWTLGPTHKPWWGLFPLHVTKNLIIKKL